MLKNSPATDPDSISNFYIKHFGPFLIQSLANIFNHLCIHGTVLKIWKLAKVILLIKPQTNQLPCFPSPYITSFLSIQTLQWTYSQQHQTKQASLVHPHNMAVNLTHSTTTMHTDLQMYRRWLQSTLVLLSHTVVVVIDINKGFDTIHKTYLIPPSIPVICHDIHSQRLNL